MKNYLLCVSGLVGVSLNVCAVPVFWDDFNSYSAGNLVGQGTWAQTGSSTATPIQVTAGKASIGTSGQDAYSPLPGGPISIADGTSFYLGLTLNVSAAQSTGDYFLHYTPTVGDSSLFLDRLFVKSSGSGYVLGWLATGGGTASYGSTVLNLNQDYRLVLAYHAVAGTLNDTSAIYVNPFTDPTVELNNTAYASFTWNSTNPENPTVAAINLRQGTAANAPTLTVDDLNASGVFGDVTTFTVPEPGSLAILGGFGLLTYLLRRRSA